MLQDNNRTYGIEIEFFGIDANLSIDAHADALIGALRRRGIEAYYEGYNHETRGHWKIVRDSSIRDNADRAHRGLELVSPPMNGDHGLEQIRLACAALQEIGAHVNKSCGLHIHHHANDYKSDHFKNLISFYGKAEKQIDKLMPYSRRGSRNTYCHSLVEQWGFNHDAPMSNGRYYKVNLNSYYKYGTVEFRHHSGTIEADKIINWLDLTQRMVLRAKRSIPAWNGHSLTWFDIKQALGLVHKAARREFELVAYCESRMQALA